MAESANKGTVQRIFILAGEASGDAYGGKLVSALKQASPDVEIRAWGGEAMEKAGAQVLRHYRSLAFMGIWEVVKNIYSISKLWKECQDALEAFQPDVFVGIDYPGFNLRMAKHAKKMGIQTHHYISPSVWAWKKRRIKAIDRDVNQLHVILPFEKAWYADHGMTVNWVGHPLLELFDLRETGYEQQLDRPILLLVPGSRKQELETMLPVMIQAAHALPQFTPIIAGAPGRKPSDYPEVEQTGIKIVFGETRQLMRSAAVGMVTSGTATLEAALLGMPQVIGYRTSIITYAMARLLVQSNWIGLPNILSERTIVPELIQSRCTPDALTRSVSALHNGQSLTEEGNEQRADLQRLAGTLEGSAPASVLVAQSILKG